MAKSFSVKVYDDMFVVTGDGVKVPIAVTEDARLIPILRGLAEIKPKITRKARGPNRPKPAPVPPPEA